MSSDPSHEDDPPEVDVDEFGDLTPDDGFAVSLDFTRRESRRRQRTTPDGWTIDEEVHQYVRVQGTRVVHPGDQQSLNAAMRWALGVDPAQLHELHAAIGGDTAEHGEPHLGRRVRDWVTSQVSRIGSDQAGDAAFKILRLFFAAHGLHLPPPGL